METPSAAAARAASTYNAASDYYDDPANSFWEGRRGLTNVGFRVDMAAVPATRHLDSLARRDRSAAINEDMEAPLHELTDGDLVIISFQTDIAVATRTT
jgi:hypothetical protein